MFKVFKISIYSKSTKKYNLFGYAIQDEEKNELPDMIKHATKLLEEPKLRNIKIELEEIGE